jgi:hypothetical protein
LRCRGRGEETGEETGDENTEERLTSDDEEDKEEEDDEEDKEKEGKAEEEEDEVEVGGLLTLARFTLILPYSAVLADKRDQTTLGTGNIVSVSCCDGFEPRPVAPLKVITGSEWLLR